MVVDVLLGGVGYSLFSYNRKNFMFDKKQQQERVYFGQEMAIKQFELYREDIRDMMELTVAKMDNYLVVNALQVGFCVVLLTEGRPAPGTSPAWLHWLYAITTAGATLYLMLSIWLGMHASIAAHSFAVRMLTQFVRLPIPTKEKIETGRARATDYEAQQFQSMLRIPVWKQQFARLSTALENFVQDAPPPGAGVAEGLQDGASSVGGDSPGSAQAQAKSVSMLQHIEQYRQFQANWQAYDAYARVCMAMGTNQLLQAVGYYCLGMLISENGAPWAAVPCSLVFAACAWFLMRLDLYLVRGLLRAAGALLVAPAFLASLHITLHKSPKTPQELKDTVDKFVPLVFLVHMAWIAFMVHIAQADESDHVALPTKFRNVLFLDVFGNIASSAVRQAEGARAPTAAGPAAANAQKDLRLSLCILCRQEAAALERDLSRWESDAVAECARSIFADYTLERVAELRERLGAASAALDEAVASAQGLECPPVPAQDGAEADAGDPVWLKMEYYNSDSGTPMDFWFCCEGEQYAWSRPEEPARISILDDVEVRLVQFAERVQAFAEFAEPAAAEEPAAGAAEGEEATGGGGLGAPGTAPEAAGAAPEAGAVAGGGVAAPALGSAPERAPVLLARSVSAGGTFFVGTERHQRVHRRRPPGQMPWRTFYLGSLLLLALWGFGAAWCVFFDIFETDFDIHPAEEGGRRRPTELAPSLVYRGGWPHPFFSPKGLACRPGSGSKPLVLETYNVYELDLERGEASVPAELTECLEKHPELHAEGMRSITVSCRGADGPRSSGAGSSSSCCEAVMLGAQGRVALRCPLGDGSQDQKGACGSTQQAELLRPHAGGGRWRGLAAVGQGLGGAFWALSGAEAEEPSLVELAPRAGASAELVPRLEVPDVRARKTAHLYALGGSAVLGLEPGGKLHMWHKHEGAAESSWQLPSNATWAGICMSDSLLYFLGTSGTDGSVALWSTPVPFELREVGIERRAGSQRSEAF